MMKRIFKRDPGGAQAHGSDESWRQALVQIQTLDDEPQTIGLSTGQAKSIYKTDVSAEEAFGRSDKPERE